MCGIAGVFTVERRVDADLVAAVLRMLDAQVHRGPNDWGILLPDEAARDSQVRGLLEPRGWDHVRVYRGSAQAPAAILGTRRLSILDLSIAGRLPMGSPDGGVWITYNGEIYNFEELREELRLLGHSFQSRGDTETLVHGYREWGTDLVHRLRGMFAFAILDVRAAEGPKLFLGKDRFGIKPLYWGRHDCVFQFASEVRALMAGGLMPDEPEPRGFHGFLVYGSVPTPWTTVRGVLSLPAAHTLCLDEVSYSHPRPRRYWALPEAGSSAISRDDALARTRELLDESVRLHLVSEVPIGVFLSGGMDSSALVALASKHLPHPLTTLCVTFDEAEYAEGEHAARVARRHGAKHVEIRLRAEDFVAEIPRIFSAMDQPTIDGVNTYFVAKAAREVGLTVVLSGVGADELFWGYPGFLRAPRVAKLAAVPGVRPAAACVAWAGGRLGFSKLEKLDFIREHPLLGPYLTIRGLFSPTRAARLLGTEPLPLWAPHPAGARLTPAVYARLEAAHYLPDQLLRDTDQFGMAHSQEIRVPFLDHRLAELVFGLSAARLASSGTNKSLLAGALRDDYGPGAATRPKMGFTFPFARWMRDAWGDIERDAGPAGSAAPAAHETLTAGFRAGRVHWSRAWAVAVLRGMSSRGSLPPWNASDGPRRILVLVPGLHDSTGGVQTYLQHFVRATAEEFPHSALSVVSLNDERLPTDAPEFGRVHFTALGPRTRLLHRTRLVLAAIGTAARRSPDLVVCGHINLAPLAWGIARLARSRMALIGYGIEVWRRPSLFWRLTAGSAERVLAISRFTANQLAQWWGRRDAVLVVANAVDGEVFRPLGGSRHGAAPRMLTVARLAGSERYKGIDRVLRALPVVREACPGVKYLIAGEGDDRPRLETLAEDLALGGHVEFLGFVPGERLPMTYSGADLFLMPSLKEGFGFVFLEALACGTPVIAGNRDGSVDALLDGRLGRLVDPDDGAALTDAIVSALEARRTEDGGEARYLRRRETLRAYGFDRFRARVRDALVNVATS